MHYPGPEPSDFENVRALNAAFLELVSVADRAAILSGPPDRLLDDLASLGPRRSARLAHAPFLLFSLRERDTDVWEALLGDGASLELFPSTRPAEPDCARLVAAGLSFAWQLARRNSFALRLLTGASLHWCEELAARPLVSVLSAVSGRSDLLRLRFSDNAAFWHKLLDAGVSSRRDLRTAAQLTAWQTLLTRHTKTEPAAWAAAACRNRVPALKVAEKPDR